MRWVCLFVLLWPGIAAAVDDSALMAARPAKLLSDYALFADGPGQVPAEGVIPYDLSTPLFSDHAKKLRFAYVPGRADWSDDEVFEFPVGTALVKTFAYPDETGLHLIETRLLVRQEVGWVAWPYLWDEASGDAKLKLAGARLDVDTVGPDGDALTVNYRVPNANQCKTCHGRAGAITPIGPKARNLNHEFAYGDASKNQIAHWQSLGFLAMGRPPSSADWRNGALNDRARAYLDVNCAHCHRRDGSASNSGLFLAYGEADPVAWGRLKRPVAAGRGSGGLEFDITPGDPAASIMVHRMRSTDPGVMMPELGRSLPHAEGIALIKAWIAAME